jgi:cell pole-organizing protein PopZ
MRNNDDDDMSMDDILASIRRYVSTDDSDNKDDNRVIRLTADQEVNRMKREGPPQKEFLRTISSPLAIDDCTLDDPVRASASSLAKLQEVKPKSQTNTTIEQFLCQIIKDWLDKNMPPIVEKTVQKEIEKIKKAM